MPTFSPKKNLNDAPTHSLAEGCIKRKLASPYFCQFSLFLNPRSYSMDNPTKSFLIINMSDDTKGQPPQLRVMHMN